MNFAPSYYDAKNKTIRYDYFGGEVLIGEYVNYSSTNTYVFNLSGLRGGVDYSAYFWAEDFNGNVANNQTPTV